ncbi:MAG: ATP-binding protein, partial [Pirellulaceae bacterium]
KRAEEEIRRINKELQKRNDEMQQFVYTISHDLKSPLVTCKGFMGLMKEDALAGRWDVVLDSVGRIERAIQRMGDLIEDLLQLSRIGVIRNEPEDVDVGQMVRAIADELADRLHHAGATLRVHEPLPHVIADRVRLAEVFENLLSNAIKYGCRGENGRIEIGGLTAAHEIRFYVRDHGPGIAKEFHRKIFGLFQRLESNQEGTGVGLAAVARIMETHGGRSWVESAPGQGATFWIAFPAICAVVARPFDLQTAPDAAETLTTRG